MAKFKGLSTIIFFPIVGYPGFDQLLILKLAYWMVRLTAGLPLCAIVPTMIVVTAVPTIIVLTAYYWKSCVGNSVAVYVKVLITTNALTMA